MAPLLRHRLGSRFVVTAGTHKGKNGTIVKANRICHRVNFNDGSIGFVNRSFCDYIGPVADTAVTPRTHVGTTVSVHQEEAVSSEGEPTSSHGLDSLSDYDPEETSHVLMYLLANSSADMSPTSEQWRMWVNRLRDRLIILRHGRGY
jgi:hypothetical protein